MEQHNNLEKKMEEIHVLEAANKEIILKKRREVHDAIADFSNYWDLYSFIKRTTFTQEEFNEVMGRMRKTFLNTRH